MIDLIQLLHEHSNDLGTLVICVGVYVLWELQKSTEKLNTQIAVIIERVDNHERRLGKLEDYK